MAHPANTATIAKNGKIREMNMDCQCS
jgi:hypothetical protein